jgi:phage terminase large subunit
MDTEWRKKLLAAYLDFGKQEGCGAEQIHRFFNAKIFLQPIQLRASAAARSCDCPDGPMSIGYGGARAGGKSHWLLAQMGADDCQRMPGLKCLLLRKVGKSNKENFSDFRRRLFQWLPHEYSASRGILTFENGSRIIAGHFQHDKDIDAYLGLEYDIIGIEEATTLSNRKQLDIITCCRTSRQDWRPRVYSTTNPGGVGHNWYKSKYVDPHQRHAETMTRFIPAKISDNCITNVDYGKHVLAQLTGWQKRAWYDGGNSLAVFGRFL